MPVAVGNFLGQIEHVILYLYQTLVKVASHVAVSVPCVLNLLVGTVLEVHRPGVGQLIALVGNLLEPVAVAGDREIANNITFRYQHTLAINLKVLKFHLIGRKNYRHLDLMILINPQNVFHFFSFYFVYN